MFVICDSRITAEMEHTLNKYGYTVIKLPPDRSLPTPIASHPDTLIAKIKDDFLTTCDYAETAAYVFSDIREYSKNSRLIFCDEHFNSKHPGDAVFNALVIGKYIFINKKTISPKVLDIAQKRDLIPINVNQSYPNCTVLALNESSAITSDIGMYRALTSRGIETLLIRQGYISLPPYSYGFIGGASGVYKGRVFFFGDITKHPDIIAIKNFIENKDMTVVSLSSEDLIDLGGMIFL